MISKKKIWLKVLFAILFLQLTVSPLRAEITLRKAYELALENNDQIAITAQELRRAQNNITIASSALMPQLTLSGQAQRQKEMVDKDDDPVVDKTDASGRAEMSLHLYHGGKPWFQRRGSQFNFEATEEDVFRTRQAILFQVAGAYYQVLLSQRNVEIEEASLRRAQTQLERSQGLFDVGEITRTGVLRARVEVSRSEANLQEARNSLELARDDFLFQLGLDELPGEISDDDIQEYKDRPIDEYLSEAFRTRRDLEAAHFQQQAAAEAVKAERATWFPEINLVSSYDVFDEERHGENDDWRVMVRGSYPLFSGWRNSAEIDNARAEYKQAVARSRELRRGIKNEVREAVLNLHTRGKLIISLREQVNLSKQNYEEITAQYEEALVTSLDVSDAHDLLRESEQKMAQNYYTYQLEILALDLATGSFASEILKENNL